MRRELAIVLILTASVGIAAWLFESDAVAQETAAPGFTTVWDGVYTPAQAERGRALSNVYCKECHGPEGVGGKAPPLRGDRFMQSWQGGGLDNLFDYMSTRMPAERPRGDLDEESYLDMLAFMLRETGFPAGSRSITREPLWTIHVVGKDGPKPLPSQTSALSVGCLTQGADGLWTLNNAIEPFRNKNLDEALAREVSAYGGMPLGSLTFKLNNVAEFNPGSRKGQKVLVKGVLGRLATGDRINVTFMETVSANCGT